MKKIFITGGSGFIGRNLKETFVDNFEVQAPRSSELDLLDFEQVAKFLKEKNFDIVIHAATWNATTTSTKDLTKVLENNLRMFFNLARCGDQFGKMIYFGSGAEFSRDHWIPKMSEDYFDSYVPTDQYGFSKYIMAKYAFVSTNIVNLRLFGVFGKYEDWEIRFISNACCKAVWDLPITIRQNVFFDYMHIDDLCKIANWFVENDSLKRTYNVCTGTVNDLVTLAKSVLTASGKTLPIQIGKEGLGAEYSGDNSLLLDEMGGFNFSSISSNIDSLYRYYADNKSLIDKNKLVIEK